MRGSGLRRLAMMLSTFTVLPGSTSVRKASFHQIEGRLLFAKPLFTFPHAGQGAAFARCFSSAMATYPSGGAAGALIANEIAANWRSFHSLESGLPNSTSRSRTPEVDNPVQRCRFSQAVPMRGLPR
jgi:hypothetical protein